MNAPRLTSRSRMHRMLGLRPEDVRIVGVAFVTLTTIVASHAVLETARDALFLAGLPVRFLPWAYLGIASLSFAVARAGRFVSTLASARRRLAATLLFGALGTAAFWRLVAGSTSTALISLYVWTGLLASVVVTQFWIDLGDRMDVGQARRAYPLIAAGGMLGATLGSLLAGAALTVEGPRFLLPLASLMFLTAACLTAVGGQSAVAVEAGQEKAADAEEAPRLGAVWQDPYLRRVLLLAALAPVVAMGVDFLFKSVVAANVPREELGPFFARYNTVVNAAAFLFQFTLAPRILQNAGVVRSLCVLPAGLGVMTAAVAATAALPAALLLRGTDGVLRHSLHRAATEILFLPLSNVARGALRSLTESLGQRGGQVAGSLVILGAIAMGVSPSGMAAGIAVLCALWLVGNLGLQKHYVERFRGQLRMLTSGSSAAVPDLDLQSLELLVAALSSASDAEVLAALDMLSGFGRSRLVTPLILYHPSTAVVLKALEFFDDVKRDDVQEMRRRLLDHRDPVVRAAALRSLVANGYDRAIVRTVLRSDQSPQVRYTALTLWTASQDGVDVDEAIADLVNSPDAASRLAIATTLGDLPARMLLPVAQALLANATPAIRRQVARALALSPDEERIPLLAELTAIPECRASARAALVSLGVPALEYAAQLLADAETAPPIRRHLPRTISAFRSVRAAQLLVEQLDRERDSRVNYKILRGLGRLVADDPELPVDRSALAAEAERTLRRTIELLAYRVGHDVLREPTAWLDSPRGAHELIAALLVEKEQRGLECLFRVLKILEPGEDLAAMYSAISSDNPVVRASARELVGQVLEAPFVAALLALTDSLPAAERLEAASRAMPVESAEAALAALKEEAGQGGDGSALLAVMTTMSEDRSEPLAALARYLLGRDRTEGDDGSRR